MSRVLSPFITANVSGVIPLPFSPKIFLTLPLLPSLRRPSFFGRTYDSLTEFSLLFPPKVRYLRVIFNFAARPGILFQDPPFSPQDASVGVPLIPYPDAFRIMGSQNRPFTTSSSKVLHPLLSRADGTDRIASLSMSRSPHHFFFPATYSFGVPSGAHFAPSCFGFPVRFLFPESRS